MPRATIAPCAGCGTTGVHEAGCAVAVRAITRRPKYGNRLCDVRPCYAVNDLPRRSLTYVELGREFIGGHTACGMDAPHFSHCIGGSFSTGYPCPACPTGWLVDEGVAHLAALTDHVRHIHSRGAKEQVVRPHARRVIAMVTDKEVVGGRLPIGYLPGSTVGGGFPPIVVVETPISAGRTSASPQPATVRLINLSPETLCPASFGRSPQGGTDAGLTAITPAAAFQHIQLDGKGTTASQAEPGHSGVFHWHIVLSTAAQHKGQMACL